MPQINWRFSFKVLMPVLVAVLVTLGVSVGFILWSAMKSDDRALERQTKIVSHMLDEAREIISKQQDAVTPWDEAVEALRGKADIDHEWVASNLGYDVFSEYKHNRIYVLDPDLNPVYAMREGSDTSVDTFEADRDGVAVVANRLRGLDGETAIGAYNNGFGGVPKETDVSLVDGKPALVSAVPIVSESDEHDVEPSKTYIHVAVRFLDDALAAELMQQFLLDNVHFATDPTAAKGEAVLPITDKSGKPIAWFKWTPDRPGAQILEETLPAMLAVLVVAGIVIFVLMRRLRKSSDELEAARAEAHHRSLHDPLTGLANRTMFQERLTQALAGLNRGGDPLALLALDLDRFKAVNDTLGHEAGDELLKQVSARLKALLRDTDTLARLGGDEFVVLQNAIKAVGDAETLSQRIIAKVSEPYRLAGTDVRIGVSIGVAVARDAALDGLDLPARADFALYQAKEAGRNTFRLYDAARKPDEVAEITLAASTLAQVTSAFDKLRKS
jgi:diguanylate cyclase (GGDEF)-like protein